MLKLFIFILYLLVFSLPIFGQVDTTLDNFYKPIIDELNQIERVNKEEARVSVAGFTTTTLRESPGIVSLITSEDIQRMGARDLTDVLRFIPGFDLSIDVLPVLTMRGNGVNEGKALILIDGHIINNISTGYAYIFQRFPLDNIDRIEIIRGAGSAIYGGLAGLAVINIYTKKNLTQKQETHASALTSVTANGFFRSKVEAYSLNRFKGGIELDLSASYQKGQLLDADYQSPVYAQLVEGNKYSSIEAGNFNVGLRYKRLDIRFLQNNYQSVYPEFDNTKLHMSASLLSIGYDFLLSNKLTLYTKVTWGIDYSFFSELPRVPTILGGNGQDKLLTLGRLNLSDMRYLTKNYVVYKPIETLTISAGVELYVDRARYINSNNTFTNNQDQVTYSNLGVFAEANWNTKFGNITTGVRMDKYANIEPVAVPRIAFTRAFKMLHFKALYSEAFKTPTIGNIENPLGNTTLLAERFRLIEFETGLKLNKNFQCNLNVYDILIKNFIKRTELTTNQIVFTNDENIGTQGIEGEARYQNDKLMLQFGYSFYRLSPSTPEILSGLPTVTPGTPAQKASLVASYKLNRRIVFGLNFIYLTNKFRGSTLFSADVAKEFKNEQHLNTYFQYNDFIIKNLSFYVGCYNVLNQTHTLVSWKKDLFAEITSEAQKREFLIKLIYQIKN